jgi:small multidrug resistance family-3 protein
MKLLQLTGLFFITAIAEMVGCYLFWLVIKQKEALWLVLPGTLALIAFAYLLTLHPSASGRTYAAYGGMYIVVALLWLRLVDEVPWSKWDMVGVCLALTGMAVIALQDPH